jgi:hypothetical protein
MTSPDHRWRPSKHVAVLLTATSMLVAGSAGGASARVDYDLVHRPFFAHNHGVYGLVFKLDRRLPRSPNRRVLATVSINGHTVDRLVQVAGQPHCYVASLESSLPPVHFGQKYRIAIEIPNAEALQKHLRLRHDTPGFGAFYANPERDPAARYLHCRPR